MRDTTAVGLDTEPDKTVYRQGVYDLVAWS